jgi:hypothetical protein
METTNLDAAQPTPGSRQAFLKVGQNVEDKWTCRPSKQLGVAAPGGTTADELTRSRGHELDAFAAAAQDLGNGVEGFDQLVVIPVSHDSIQGLGGPGSHACRRDERCCCMATPGD